MLLKKKILAALSLMTVSALLVAGCGGGDAKKEAAKPDAKGGEKIVLNQRAGRPDRLCRQS